MCLLLVLLRWYMSNRLIGAGDPTKLAWRGLRLMKAEAIALVFMNCVRLFNRDLRDGHRQVQILAAPDHGRAHKRLTFIDLAL